MDVDRLTDMVLEGIERDGLCVLPRELWGRACGGRVMWEASLLGPYEEVCAVSVGPLTLHMDAAVRGRLQTEMWSQNARPIDMTPPPRRRGEESE